MGLWLPELEQHGELDVKRLSEHTRTQLQTISEATIDRILKPTCDGATLVGLSGTRPGPLLRNSIQVRKAGDEHEKAPGFVEVDLVLYCGANLQGEFVHNSSVENDQNSSVVDSTAAERNYEAQLLLRGEWSPVTDVMQFARASAKDTVHAMMTGVSVRHLRTSTGYPFVASHVRGNGLADLLEHLLPFEARTGRLLVIPAANPKWSAVFDSGIVGESGAAAWLSVGGLECVSVRDTPQRRDYSNRSGSYGCRSITQFMPTAEGDYRTS